MYIYFSEPLESLVDFFSYSWNKESIYSVDLTHFDTTQLTSLSGTFYECSNLKEVNLTNFDTSTVWEMDAMFAVVALENHLIYQVLIHREFLLWMICFQVVNN